MRDLLFEQDIEKDVKQFFFSKNSKKILEDSIVNEQLRNFEGNLIIESINNKLPIKNYKIKRNSQYNVVIQSSKYSIEVLKEKLLKI